MGMVDLYLQLGLLACLAAGLFASRLPAECGLTPDPVRHRTRPGGAVHGDYNSRLTGPWPVDPAPWQTLRRKAVSWTQRADRRSIGFV